jgi:predicted O-linked N-acetylglucosamine transferase (SPINDLY family)
MRESLESAMRSARGGGLANALATVRTIVRTQPGDAEARTVLGFLLSQSGEHEQAAHHLGRVVAAQPKDPRARNNLANALMQSGRWQDASAQFRTATELDPGYRPAWLGLCTALMHGRDAAGAVQASDAALRIHEPWPELMMARTGAMAMCDRVEDGVAELRRSAECFPTHAGLRGSLLLALNSTGGTAEEVAEAHRGYARCVTAPAQPPSRDPDPDRPIHVGILTADLRTHSVGYFARAILAHRPPCTTVTAFSASVPTPDDPMTADLRAACDGWVDVAVLDDAALDRAIRDRGIDVLVELNGHTGGNRLPALDRKPAPVIATAIGYPNTTGHPCIDWRFVDAVTDPPGTEARCTERLVRLDPCFLCYAPPADAPEPAMPGEDAPPTFGSFNEAKKLQSETIALWAPVLHAVPESRLAIKARSAAEPAVRASILARFGAAGIDAGRIDILPFAADTRGHLAQYARVHVALDPTPYNGTTTTCEALWMGVPVVTLEGDRHAARVGTSLLRTAGLGELVAPDAAAFTRIAAGLVRDRERLVRMRSGLRGTLAASPLTDAPAYGRRFHDALRACWREWCARSRA